MDEDRRKVPRIDIGPKKRPELIISDKNYNRIPTNLINLSRGGAGFLSRESFSVNESVRLTLLLPETRRRIITKGTIKHKEEFVGLFGYGMELHLSEEDMTAMADYIVLSISKV